MQTEMPTRTTFSYVIEKFFKIFGVISIIVYVFTYIGISLPLISDYFESVHNFTKIFIGIIFFCMYNPYEFIRSRFNTSLSITQETKRMFAFSAGTALLISSGLDILILQYSKKLNYTLKTYLSQV